MYRKLDKIDSMILRIMSHYLRSCNEDDFTGLESLIDHLHDKFNSDRHLSLCAIQESKFWTWLIPDEYIVEFAFE